MLLRWERTTLSGKEFLLFLPSLSAFRFPFHEAICPSLPAFPLFPLFCLDASFSCFLPLASLLYKEGPPTTLLTSSTFTRIPFTAASASSVPSFCTKKKISIHPFFFPFFWLAACHQQRQTKSWYSSIHAAVLRGNSSVCTSTLAT